MADYIKTHSGPNQVAFTSSVDQQVQYRQIVYAIINALRLSGWTVVRSSNGTTASAADNIASVADIVWGTEGTQVHTWAALTPPSGKGNPLSNANTLLINCNNINTDTTPQNVDFYIASGTYVGGANGTTSIKPSILAGGFEHTVALALNVIPWTSAAAGSLCVWYTTDGDVTVMVKLDAVSNFRMWWHIGDDDNNAIGNYTMIMGGAASASADVVTSAILTGASGVPWRALQAGGAANLSTVLGGSIPWVNATSFTNGQESTTTGLMLRDIELGSNASGSDSRILGLWVDVYGCPANSIFNQEDANDNGNSAPFVPRTVGDIVMPCDTAIT